MAKKKSNLQHSQNLKPPPPPPQQQEAQVPPPPPTMDDSSSQIQNLKNLNAKLLKEATDRRNQLDSLVQENKALQSKLERSAAAEETAALEVERSVLLAFAVTQAREMGIRFDEVVAERNDAARAVSEKENDVVVLEGEVKELAMRLEDEKIRLSSVSGERDGAKSELARVVGEAEKLKEKILEAEERERKFGEEAERLRSECERLLEEGKGREVEIGKMKKEMDLVMRSREERDDLIEKLKAEIDKVSREKKEIEKMKNECELRIVELESEMKKLEESLEVSHREQTLASEKVREMEERLGALMEKGERMEMEVKDLMREKEEMEKRIEILTVERDDVEKVRHTVQKELERKQREIDDAVRARDEIEQEKVQLEYQIAEMQREVDRLRDVAEKFKESCREFDEKNKQLISEIEHCRRSEDEAAMEKYNMRKVFDEEKSKVKKLMLQVSGMEERIVQTEAELAKSRSEHEKLIEKNKRMESRVVVLEGEKDSLQRSLAEAERASDDLRGKVEFSCANSSMTLAMLKNTAALVCQNKGGVVEVTESNGKKLEEDIQPFAEELDAIKNAFRSKNEMVDDMKQQLESLHKSVAEAHKSKSLWTVISSATTIFAAAMAAFAARGR